MNLIFSYTVKHDKEFEAHGHVFLGSGHDRQLGEVHVWLMKGSKFPEGSINQIKELCHE